MNGGICARWPVRGRSVALALGALVAAFAAAAPGATPPARAALCDRTIVPSLKARDQAVPGRIWCVLPQLSGRRLDAIAGDVSGFACVDANRCLAVSDEARFAQLVAIDHRNYTLSPRRFVYLVRTPVSSKGNDRRAAGELDLEAAAAAGGRILVIGSHGRSREGALEPQRFAVFSVDLAPDQVEAWPGERDANATARAPARGVDLIGDAVGPKGGVVRALVDQVEPQADGVLHTALSRCVQNNGFNIEGLAVAQNRIFLGLRSPLDGPSALILSADLQSFLGGEPEGAQLHRLPLDGLSGVRGLEPLEDGLLVLTGRAQAEKAESGDCAEVAAGSLVESALFFWGGPARPNELRELARFTDKALRPETLHVLRYDHTDGELEVLVFFDGEDSGAPVSYRIPFRR